LATVNDGSCTYPATSVSLTNAVPLPTPTLDESSGLVYTDGALWTHNDSGNPPAIYKINETTGAIIQTVNITNATNTDWEDITADANYFYIGDFGNNGNGIRTDLRVYKINKADITSAATVNVVAEIINFSYSDQVIGASPGSNNTAFDCEAFFVKNNTLHLFTKDWVTNYTKHYQLSTAPGTYSITSNEPFLNVHGLITSADISSDNQIALVGYDDGGVGIFMYLLYDYTGTNYFSGNVRKLDLGNAVDFGNSANSKGQVEAVSFTSNGNGYISNERITSFSVPARFYSFSVANLLALPVNLVSFTASYREPAVDIKWETLSESNSSYFAIERSSDALIFKEIGREPAAGSSNNIKVYLFDDTKPVQGNNYYRLKQVDIDGAEKILGVRTVNVKKAGTALKAYIPSGSSNTLVVDAGNIDISSVYYRIISLNGALLKRDRLHSSSQTVSITSLARGQYILALSNGTSARFQKL
jgi:hypothetical protein